MNPDTEDYIKTIFGEVRPEHKLLDKYLPGYLEGNTLTRRTIYPHPKKDKEAVIPRKYRELMIIALEVGSGRGGAQGEGSMPGIIHTRMAVKEAGATPQEIAETVALATYFCGQPTMVDFGYHCIREAEKQYENLKGQKK
jgi:alkylhydroperoxidase/carboxymuconolactone decarboxylase family protein YurZ